MDILYWGYNSFNVHKRGVENVIDFQSNTFKFNKIFYFHWGVVNKIYKSNKFICVSIKKSWYWPVVFNLVLYRIRISKNVVIHSHNPIFSFFSIYKTNILTIHDGLYYLAKQGRHKFTIIFLIIEFLTYYRCTYLHFISNYTLKMSLSYREKNFFIIPNTSNYENLFNFSIVNLTDNIYKINNKINVLIVRSIEDRARFDLLIEVVKKLKDSNYFFNIVGKGPLLEKYIEIVTNENLTNICFHGYVNDIELMKYYSSCDLVLMIAEFGEGFGLPIIEGYLFNKPVIASNKCAIPEIIYCNNDLFENSVDSILEKLNFTFNSEFNKVDYNLYYMNKYSNKIIFAQYLQLYNRFNN